MLGVSNSTIRRTHLTKAGNLIVEPTDESSRAIIEAATLPANLTMKPLDGKKRAPTASQFIVIKGVHPDIDTAKLEDLLKFPCKRLLSAANGGKPTLKIKVAVKDPIKQKKLLENGVQIGSFHFRATPYTGETTGALMCHKCYALGHVARACPLDERLCRRCGGGHLVKNCTSPAACVNCGGEHEATHPSCTKIIQQKENKEAKTLTYAAAAKRSGDKVEMLQLAGCIASCLVAYSKRTTAGVDQAAIYKDVANSVSATYRVSLKPTHVKAQALQIADPSDAAHND